MDPRVALNAAAIAAELDWLSVVLDLRLRHYFGAVGEAAPSGAEAPEKPGAETAPSEPEAPEEPDTEAASSEAAPQPGLPSPLSVAPPPVDNESDYAGMVRALELDVPERLALALALAAELRPQALDVFAIKNSATGRRFTEFGGVNSGPSERFVPTGETLAFVLDGGELLGRIYVVDLLGPDHAFARNELLTIDLGERPPPLLQAPMRVPADTLGLLTRGRVPPPRLSMDFPARRLETPLSWDDLVLHPVTRRQVDGVMTWLDHGETLLYDWGMVRKLRPGLRVLFHGPPGTGKSMTAALLGASTGREVYRIDLSMIVSKYIGETEKNLARVFDRAERRGWLLFFDEADALFGKRGETKDSHDRYANQEVAYLLQRIESFDGVTILASNLPENLDDAFTRRFESVIYFPTPRPEERLSLWRKAFPERAPVEGVDFHAIAREYELSGGAIMNVVRQVCLESIAADGQVIDEARMRKAIRRELKKEGKGL